MRCLSTTKRPVGRRTARLLAGLVLLAGVVPARGETPEEKGLAIVTEAERRDAGWQDASGDIVMTLRNSRNEESVRYMRSRALELKEDGDKSLVVFDQPLDVKGTALLTHAHKTKADDQWLYLPALKRVKRIAGANKSGPFMGSEFAYEDLSTQEIEKYQYKYIRDEPIDGAPCFVVERVPNDKESGYSRQLVWIDQAEYRAQKVEFYDRKGELMKTLTMSAYQKFLDKHWRATKLTMVNHQTNKSTTIEWKNIAFKQGLTDKDFDVNSLSLAR